MPPSNPLGKANTSLTDPLRYDRAMTTPPFRIPSKRLTPGKPINVLNPDALKKA